MRPEWSRREDRLIRRHTPEIAARLTGRPLAAVRRRQAELQTMPRRETTRSGRTKYRRWTPEEDELILKRPPSEISRLIGRSFRAVHCRRAALRKKLTGPTP
jgi:hypothetical protein